MLAIKLFPGDEVRIIHNGEHMVIRCTESQGKSCKIVFPAREDAPGWEIWRESLYKKRNTPSVPVRAEPVGGHGES